MAIIVNVSVGLTRGQARSFLRLTINPTCIKGHFARYDGRYSIGLMRLNCCPDPDASLLDKQRAVARLRNDQWDTVSIIASTTGADIGDQDSDDLSVRDFEEEFDDGMSVHSFGWEGQQDIVHLESIDIDDE